MYMPMGDVTASDFVTVSGVCKPTNFATLDKFKEFQRQLNRMAQAKGLPKITVDGDIGPGTTKLLANVQAGAMMSCSAIATVVEALTAQVKASADAAGVPGSVSSPKPASPPAIVNAATGVLTPQPASSSVLDAFGNLGSTEKILAVAILGGGAYLLLNKKRKRR